MSETEKIKAWIAEHGGNASGGRAGAAGGDSDGGAEADSSTWTPIDLGPIVAGDADLEPAPVMLERSDGKYLFYAAKIHLNAGEPESGKGWLTLLISKERIEVGEHVLWLDFEDEAPTVVARLRALAVADSATLECFHYVRPDEPLTDEGRREIERVLDEHNPQLAIFDGFTDALGIHGIDLRDNTEVAKWMRDLPTTLRRRGVAVVINDHVPKDPERRGRGAIGAQHKLAKVDVAYHLHVDEPLGRGLVGRVLIRVEKDRPGHVRRLANGRTVAIMIATGSDDGAMTISIEPATAQSEEGQGWRPTGYMEKVSRAVEAEPGLSIRAVRQAVVGGNDYIDRAREVLVREGWMEGREEGSAIRHYVLYAYREAEDQTVPETVPEPCRENDGGNGQRDRATVPTPKGGTGHGTRPTVPNSGAEPNRHGTPPVDSSPLSDSLIDETEGPGAPPPPTTSEMTEDERLEHERKLRVALGEEEE